MPSQGVCHLMVHSASSPPQGHKGNAVGTHPTPGRGQLAYSPSRTVSVSQKNFTKTQSEIRVRGRRKMA